MDLARMLEKCRRDQWSIDDLDWSRPPRPMPRAKEEAVVQYFTDMAAIERLAAALFEVQGRKTDDPTLRAIFDSFVVDELRHAEVAERLARYYDVHGYRTYRTDPNLLEFRPHFLTALEHLSPDIANAYVTSGEMLLDVALLRSLDDYVDDEMSHEAMRLINRDESRHIAVDFHMVERYSSDEYLAAKRRQPRTPLRRLVKGWWAFGCTIYRAGPFLRTVFLEPMDLTDPSGRRLLEAFKRLQLLSNKPTVARLPFTRVMLALQALYNHPLTGPVFGRLLIKVLGMDPRVVAVLYTPQDLERARRMSFDELAAEAVGAKYDDGAAPAS